MAIETWSEAIPTTSREIVQIPKDKPQGLYPELKGVCPELNSYYSYYESLFQSSISQSSQNEETTLKPEELFQKAPIEQPAEQPVEIPLVDQPHKRLNPRECIQSAISHTVNVAEKISKKIKEVSSEAIHILSKESLEHLIADKSLQFKTFFENRGFIQLDIREDLSAWSDSVLSRLHIPVNENSKQEIFKKVLQNGFGTPMDVAIYMDRMLEGMEVLDREIESDPALANALQAKNFLWSKWINLAWVYNQISEQPLPFPTEQPQRLLPLLFGPSAPPFSPEEIEQPSKPEQKESLDRCTVLYKKLLFARDLAANERKPKEIKPVEYTLSNSLNWFEEIPAKIKFQIFDNIINGVQGPIEDKVKKDRQQKFEIKNGIASGGKWNDFWKTFEAERADLSIGIYTKRNELKEKVSVINHEYSVKNTDLPQLKQEIHQFLDSAKLNELFDSGIFSRYIYEQAKQDGVFDRKPNQDLQWGEHHAAHKVDRFLSAFERYRIVHID